MLELRGISAGYRNGPIIEDITLSFPSGTVTVLIGPNGCGKSTLLKTAGRLLKPMSGSLYSDGEDAGRLSQKAFARRVAMLPQAREIPAIPVDMLVMHGRFPYLGFPRIPLEKDRRLAEAAMERAGVLSLRHQELAALSGGERQRAYLAMLLAQDAETVLLDEPSTYLDIGHQLETLRLLDGLRREGRAVAAVMHDLPQALAAADTIVLMVKGRIRRVGTPEEVFASGEIEKVFGVCGHRLFSENGREHYVFTES